MDTSRPTTSQWTLLELTYTTMNATRSTNIPMDAFGANLHYNGHYKVNYIPMDAFGANLHYNERFKVNYIPMDAFGAN